MSQHDLADLGKKKHDNRPSTFVLELLAGMLYRRSSAVKFCIYIQNKTATKTSAEIIR